MRTQFVSALFAAFVLTAGTAQADWQASYKAFQQAAAAGDQAGMVRHAEEAWKQSRETLSPSENRALLAQNYLMLVLFTDPDAVVKVTEDLETLAAAGFGTANLSLETVQFLNAFAQSEAAPKHRQKVRRAAKAAALIPERDLPINDIILAQQMIAKRQITLQQSDEVRPYLDRLSARLVELPEMDVRTLQNLEALRMISVVSNVPRVDRAESKLNVTREQERFIEDIKGLVRNFRMLSNKYEPQTSIDTFDPNLAEAMAWEDLAMSYLVAWENKGKYNMFVDTLPSFKSGLAKAAGCGTYDLTQSNVTFPASAQNYNGAVLVGYHLDDDGRTYGARVLSEIPARRFGDHLLGQVEKFRADVSGLHQNCGRDQLFTVQFYILPPM